MKLNEPGVIRNRVVAEQGRDFSEMRFGTITPTDFDAFIDYRNKLFVLVEAKHLGADLPRGQRIALERAVDRWRNGGVRAVGFVVDHDTPPQDQIPMGLCLVREYYTGNDDDWRQPRAPIQINSAVGLLIAQIEGRLLV